MGVENPMNRFTYRKEEQSNIMATSNLSKPPRISVGLSDGADSDTVEYILERTYRRFGDIASSMTRRQVLALLKGALAPYRCTVARTVQGCHETTSARRVSVSNEIQGHRLRENLSPAWSW